VHTVEVRFKGTRKGYFTWPDDAEPLRLRDPVIVEVERGRDYGRVTATGAVAQRKCGGCSTGACGVVEPATDEPLKPVIRRATPDDTRNHHECRRSEEEVRQKVIERVRHHGLVMKVSDTEWQWDRNKLTIYFTAEQRVDFRALVRDLASLFRTRIELRQIGVRDEAGRIGGVGTCGRELCCATWLRQFEPITLKMAKDQGLSPSPSKISGACGRLKCCLRYELDFYKESAREFPKIGSRLTLEDGEWEVKRVDIFHRVLHLFADADKAKEVGLEDLPPGTRIAGPSRDRRKGCDKKGCESRGAKPGDGENPPQRTAPHGGGGTPGGSAPGGGDRHGRRRGPRRPDRPERPDSPERTERRDPE
jgi:cell fate regulator YaaT (PSP1 superfamily)